MSNATEYQQVAALLAMDIDTMAETAERQPSMAIALLQRLKENKDQLTTDKEHREMRYNAACAVFGAVASGQVKCTEIKQTPST